jgi:hypothetical protein
MGKAPKFKNRFLKNALAAGPCFSEIDLAG